MLTILVVFGSGLALFAALTVTGWICRWHLEPSLDERMAENRTATLLDLRQAPRQPQRNGHSRYGLTWPKTRSRR